MADTPEEIQKHMRAYWKVGIALLVCTGLTVFVAEVTPSITIGLGIAAFKAGLVAMIFMHLNAEKPIIYKILAYTVFFFFGLMFLTILALYDPLVSRW
jgi:caa(3)-type oxidase subunit IV